MTTVAFIPIRGGSKSIPHKNIQPLLGSPLVHWTMRAALGCDHIDSVYVASEDPMLREVASRIAHSKLCVVDRDPATATDTASTESALLDFANHFDFDRVVLIQATSPQLTSSDLNGAFEKLAATRADSLVSVVREHRFLWREDSAELVSALNYDPLRRPRRQDWSGEFVENGAFYITTKAALTASRCRLSGKITYYEMSRKTAVELDEPIDWLITEHLLKRENAADSGLAARCRKIRALVCDMDGTLTDSGIYVTGDGELSRKFSTRDGMGFGLWRKAGFKAALMTSEDTPIMTQRAAKLKIEHVFMGMKDKGETLEQFCSEQGFSLDEVAYIGDDVNDKNAFVKAGFTACPADAVDSIKAVAHYICTKKGGEGCVREVVDLVLKHKEEAD